MQPEWHIAFCNVTITEYAGIPYRDYYNSPPLMLEAQLKAIDFIERRWGVGGFLKPYVDSPAAAFPSFLGMPVVTPEADELPYIDNGRPVIPDVADWDKVIISDPRTTGLMAKRWEAWQYFRQQGYEVRFGGYEGSVITTAAEITGGAVFAGLSEYPEAAGKLLDKMVEANQALEALDTSLCGPITDGYTGDDFAGLLSPAMFREFLVPRYERLYSGKHTRFMHSELLHAEHLRIARDELAITEFHGAECRNLTLRQMHDIMGSRFWTQLGPQQMLEMSPAAINDRVKEFAESGCMCVQLYPGRVTPPANMDAAIAACDRYCIGGERLDIPEAAEVSPSPASGTTVNEEQVEIRACGNGAIR